MAEPRGLVEAPPRAAPPGGRRISGRPPAPACAGVVLALVASVGAAGCGGAQRDVVSVESAGGSSPCRIATVGYRGAFESTDRLDRFLAGRSPGGVAALADAVLTPELLRAYDVLVVEDVRAGSPGQAGIGAGIGRAYAAEEVRALQGWVAQGGGLVTLCGYAAPSEIANVNALLEPFAVRYDATPILTSRDGVPTAVTGWADHPLAAGVTRIGFDVGYPVLGAGAAIAWEPTPGQHDVARAVASGAGRVFAWGDEWIGYDSQWTSRSDYQVERLWANALGWVGRDGGCGRATTP